MTNLSDLGADATLMIPARYLINAGLIGPLLIALAFMVNEHRVFWAVFQAAAIAFNALVIWANIRPATESGRRAIGEHEDE